MRFLARLPSWIFAVVALALVALTGWAATHPVADEAASVQTATGITVYGVPVAFVLFGLVLAGVAIFERHTLRVAAWGLVAILVYSTAFVPGFNPFEHADAEWVTLTNLFLLLVGFSILARHMEASRFPEALPRVLPNNWTGGLVLLLLVAVLSSFLDNIAAAMIGGTIAGVVYKRRVQIGFLAAIVAAANAGGAGSVVGDTTTTMMWIDGVAPGNVIHAYVAAGAAFLTFALVAARQQQTYQPIEHDPPPGLRVDHGRIAVVGAILGSVVLVNVTVNVLFPDASAGFPFIGVAVWIAILGCTPFRPPDWNAVMPSVRGSVFLLSLVSCAALMPVQTLPKASPQTSLGLGFLSSIFDNIPLTALALRQGGYDWGVLAYTVGFGGSMVWFGSSAGVALSSNFPETRSVGRWLRGGWHIVLAYIVGFAVMMAWPGWSPHPPHKVRIGDSDHSTSISTTLSADDIPHDP
jgi:Na+/H+ antiporter NhaD/arsenite permease-like protein